MAEKLQEETLAQYDPQTWEPVGYLVLGDENAQVQSSALPPTSGNERRGYEKVVHIPLGAWKFVRQDSKGMTQHKRNPH